MIIAALTLAAALQDKPLEKDAGAVISKVFKKYYEAKTLSGTIKTKSVDTAGGIEFTTVVAYERPSKLLVMQDRKGRNGLNHLLVSDGVRFGYDPPRSTPVTPKPFERLFEPVTVKRAGTNQTWSHGVGDVYAVGHSSLEYCVSLDIVIAHQPHLQDFKTQAATFKLQGTVDHNGQKAYKITGQWRANADAVPSGDYVLLVGLDFDLYGFTLKEKYLVGGKVVDLLLEEVCDIKVDVGVSADLFKVK